MKKKFPIYMYIFGVSCTCTLCVSNGDELKESESRAVVALLELMHCVLFSADSVIIVDLSCHCTFVVSSPEGLAHARVSGFEFVNKCYKSFFGHSSYGLKLSYFIPLYMKVSQKKAWIFFQASLQLLKLLINCNFH